MLIFFMKYIYFFFLLLLDNFYLLLASLLATLQFFYNIKFLTKKNWIKKRFPSVNLEQEFEN